MDGVETWLTLVLAGLATFAIRASFIALAGRRDTPGWVMRLLRFVPLAVLSAIIALELAAAGGDPATRVANPRLMAGVLAAAVAWRSRNVLLTIGVGMLSLWALTALAPLI